MTQKMMASSIEMGKFVRGIGFGDDGMSPVLYMLNEECLWAG